MTDGLVIIQARMGSTRLPGKVLQEIMGKPLLQHMLNRISFSKRVTEKMIATTHLEEDRPISDFCEKKNVSCYRGHPSDVLDRFYQAARMRKPFPDFIVRLTGDCPLIDPAVIDQVVGEFLGGSFDYVANTAPPIGTFPDGMDVEVFSMVALEKAWREAKTTGEREHVTFYFWQNPKIFRCHRVDLPVSRSDYRFTVDHQEDFMVVKAVMENLLVKNPSFGMNQVIEFVDAHPEIRKLNSHIGWNEGWKQGQAKAS